MADPLILSLDRCREASLVGGKALGLARLLAAGFPVPPGFCITTAAYRQALHACGLIQAERWEQAKRLVGEEQRRFLIECQTLVRSAQVSALVEQSLGEMRQDRPRAEQAMGCTVVGHE
jgi:rifampicin phosphotransferase